MPYPVRAAAVHQMFVWRTVQRFGTLARERLLLLRDSALRAHWRQFGVPTSLRVKLTYALYGTTENTDVATSDGRAELFMLCGRPLAATGN